MSKHEVFAPGVNGQLHIVGGVGDQSAVGAGTLSTETLLTIAHAAGVALTSPSLGVAGCSGSAVGDGHTAGQVAITLPVLGGATGAQTVIVNVGGLGVDTLLHGLLGANSTVKTINERQSDDDDLHWTYLVGSQ